MPGILVMSYIYFFYCLRHINLKSSETELLRNLHYIETKKCLKG